MIHIALVAAFVAVFPLSAHAFPEMVRHHYANCTSCHVSPSGGGVITQYGRELSRELLSAGGTEKESRFFYFVEPPEWLTLGGDFRWVQTFRETPTVSSGELIRMQTDLEGAVRAGPVTFVQSFGFEAERSAVGVQGGGGEFVSRRQYLMYHLDDQITFRLGKYALNYGINVPDHIIATKRGLGWDDGSETVNLEGSYMGEAWNFFVTGSFGRPDSEFLNREKGLSLIGSRLLGESVKVGASYFHGWNELASGTSRVRDVAGPWAIVGFTPRLYLMAEVDFQRDHRTPTTGTSTTAWGMVDWTRLGWEFIQGFHVFLQQEYSKTNFDVEATKGVAYTAGLLLYPRPHFEFQLAWQKNQVPAVSSVYSDLAWIMFHFYP